ncbi:delta(3,5)-Delta(2,4)-dienoyl-CoA isomerase, mitochondrial-like [Hippopotamus amphibius kiboko]|uniref:delta(3,5)-Delta(2,4)-dienoyl-CoA isomerase, mitochondrial-like n=1 Tax=Hippopotamus amphibius kiboko TaxID=575201 RepID=UPI0025975561|nr:delta(3,5)-Delta(2,4)-dienoyl-CoA isomerase, mitochondrial-like [Hippopotamus amphibius kiboko]
MVAAIAASQRLRDLLTRQLTAPTNLGLSLSLRPMSSFAQDEASKEAPDQAPGHSYESLQVTPAQKHVLHVQLNQPEKRNAMNKAFWSEMVVCFNKIAEDADCHAVVISGAGKMFTSGIFPLHHTLCQNSPALALALKFVVEEGKEGNYQLLNFATEAPKLPQMYPKSHKDVTYTILQPFCGR